MIFSSGQLILVTGASSGIGQAIAMKCVENGATVLACGRNAEKLEQGKRECVDPKRWLSVQKDLVSSMEELPAWLRDLAKKHGRFWGLVCSAGMASMDSVRTFSLGASRELFDLNFNVPMLLAKGMADRRIHAKGGALLFISSVAALYAEKGHLLYGASKAALANAAKSLSQELAPLGLRANCIAPGIVDTPMERAAEEYMGPAYREEQLKGYPFGFGRPEDIAEMAVFLLSEKARWITGQNFVLAGGRY